MGRPNIGLLGEDTIFTPLENLGIPSGTVTITVMFLLVLLVLYGVHRFLSSEMGLAMRATGANDKMASAQGVSKKKMTILGLAISNGLVALAGALFAQSQGFADVTMGVGTIIIGLAAVIVGEAILNPRIIITALFACILGSILYRLTITLALNATFLGLQASDLNLITALLVGIAMMTPRLRSKLVDFKARRGAA